MKYGESEILSWYEAYLRLKSVYEVSSSLFGVGQERFLETYRGILVRHCSLKENKIHPNKGVMMLNYGGRYNVSKIFDFIYKNSGPNIYLDRKFAKMHKGSIVNIAPNYGEVLNEC